MVDLARKCGLITIGILEEDNRSPGLLLCFLGKDHTFGLEHFGGCEHVVTPKCDGLKLADAFLVTFGCVQGKPSLGARNQEFRHAEKEGDGEPQR